MSALLPTSETIAPDAAAAPESADETTESTFQRDRLVGSVRSRTRQSAVALGLMALLTALFLSELTLQVSRTLLVLWFCSVTGLLVLRWLVARRAEAALGTGSYAVAQRFDRHFRHISLASQTVVGAGVWLAWGVDDPVAGYVMTLLVFIYLVAAMVNLAHDAESFRLSAPLLIFQPALFWFLQGGEGIAMGVGALGLLALMYSSVRTSQAQFDAAIRMRHEKNELLQALDAKNAQLNVALAAADRANRAKGFFLATASHDLRQPIIAAALATEMMQRSTNDEAMQKGLADQGVMLRETQTMLDNLLDLAQFEEGTVQARMRAMPLQPTFERLRATYGHTCESRGLRFNLVAADLWVHCDPQLLQRLLGNLVGNAVKYTQRGSVAVHAERRGDAVVISVSDTGRGISELHRQSMFEPFVRIPSAQDSDATGAGLGLAIVRGIAGVLGIELDVQSTLGAGTCISFALPASVRATEVVSVSVAESLGVQGALRGRVLWIVGADIALLRTLDPELLQLGCICGALADLDECKALWEDGEQPHLIVISGTTMPYVDLRGLLHCRAAVLPEVPTLLLQDDASAAAACAADPLLAGIDAIGRSSDHDMLVRWLTSHAGSQLVVDSNP